MFSILMTIWIVLVERVAGSVKLIQIEKNQFSVISDQIPQDITSEITSFTFNSSTLQTLKVLGNNKFAVINYDLSTYEVRRSLVFDKKCDQAIVVYTNCLVCRALKEILLMQIENNQLSIVAEIQTNGGEIVATY